jgi:hypothetical protein
MPSYSHTNCLITLAIPFCAGPKVFPLGKKQKAPRLMTKCLDLDISTFENDRPGSARCLMPCLYALIDATRTLV